MDLASHAPALQVVVPLICAPVLVMLQSRSLAWAAATATSVLTFAIAVSLAAAVLAGDKPTYEMGGWEAPYGIALAVDAFSAILLLIITGASSVALIAGRSTLTADIEAHRQPLFFAAWLLALAGLTGIVVTADAFNLFVFLEISSLASYILVAGGRDRRALPAAFKYLIMGTIGATFYLIGIGLIYMMTGTLNLDDMQIRVLDVVDQRPILSAAGFITIGLALKAAIFPLHVWLPNAYTYAPNAVTVFLAACATKVSLYVLLRFEFLVLPQNIAGHDAQFAYFLMPLAAFAIIVASGVALFERNLKRLLAYSSVAQIGFITLGASLLSVAGMTASVVHMFNHALAKGALFMAVAALALRAPGLRLDDLSGIARRMPWTFGAFVIGGLSLIGIPGTAGFISKWYLLVAAAERGALGVALIIVIAVGSLITVAYMWRIVEATCFGEPATDIKESRTEAPLELLVATWLVALANIWFGVFPDIPAELSKAAAETLLEFTR